MPLHQTIAVVCRSIQQEHLQPSTFASHHAIHVYIGRNRKLPLEQVNCFAHLQAIPPGRTSREMNSAPFYRAHDVQLSLHIYSVSSPPTKLFSLILKLPVDLQIRPGTAGANRRKFPLPLSC